MRNCKRLSGARGNTLLPLKIPMAITDTDVARITRLARIKLSPEATVRALNELNGILGLIEQLQAVDTTGVEPMAHPLSAHQNISLRLRDDIAAPTHTLDQRNALMANAPAEQDGLFLVPTVIE
jgi:aspartyl-tRNA(Asn)/glutamyl-tRNA(Gln) amidotransferase subunit C